MFEFVLCKLKYSFDGPCATTRSNMFLTGNDLLYDLTVPVYENEYIFTSLNIYVANNIKEIMVWNKYCFIRWENNPKK
jgi:hypothetical protein